MSHTLYLTKGVKERKFMKYLKSTAGENNKLYNRLIGFFEINHTRSVKWLEDVNVCSYYGFRNRKQKLWVDSL